MSQARRLTGRSARTLRSWTEKGWVPDRRLNTHRVFKRSELLALMREKGARPDLERKIAVYARVSTSEQSKKGDLSRQIERLTEGLAEEDIVVFKDVASGLSEKRKGLERLLSRVQTDEFREVRVEHTDRLARFGAKYIELILKEHQCDLIITGADEDLNDTEESELVRDMISILTSFSGRLHGARGLVTQRLKRELKNAQ